MIIIQASGGVSFIFTLFIEGNKNKVHDYHKM